MFIVFNIIKEFWVKQNKENYQIDHVMMTIPFKGHLFP